MRKKDEKSAKQTTNPFLFGKVVSNEYFCNRKKEIAAIKDHINNQYSLWLYSPRRFGKSSLVKAVFSQLNHKDIKVAYIDLFNIQTLDDFCRKYSKVISEELFDWQDDIKTITQKAGKYFKSLYPKVSFDEHGTPSFTLEKNEINEQQDIEKILQAPETIATDKKIKICIVLDEFQEINRIDPFIINWMRSVFQNQLNVSYIFLGSQQSLMKNIFTDLNSPFYEFAVKMDLLSISHSDFYKFIKNRFEKNNVHIEHRTIENILEKSERHPHFTQYFSSVVYTHICNGYDQNDDDFTQTWMESIINSQSIIFQEIFDSLKNSHRKVLVAIASLKEEEELFSGKMRDKHKLPVTSTIRTIALSLQKRGLVYKSPDRFKVSNPVMKAWLLTLD